MITRYLPGDTVEVGIPIETLIEVTDTSITAHTYLATASIQDQMLILGLVQHDSLFQFLLDSAIKESIDMIKEIIPVPEHIEPKWYDFFKAVFWILGELKILTLLFLVLRK